MPSLSVFSGQRNRSVSAANLHTPPEAVRAHVAHHGRLLGEDEMLDIVADAPVVILACVTAVAEAAAAPAMMRKAILPAQYGGCYVGQQNGRRQPGC